MSEIFGVKIEADGLNEGRLAQIREALCNEWDIEEDEIHFTPRPKYAADMLAVTAGGPCSMETEGEFCERIAAAIWKANGRYCPVRVSIEEAANVYAFTERDYQCFMKQNCASVTPLVGAVYK